MSAQQNIDQNQQGQHTNRMLLLQSSCVNTGELFQQLKDFSFGLLGWIIFVAFVGHQNAMLVFFNPLNIILQLVTLSHYLICCNIARVTCCLVLSLVWLLSIVVSRIQYQ